ncbi:Sir2 family NAD-dependent protein deacetylase [Ancylobacter sp. 6x-1]|uniref:protein acetyllysine N-acetyltransferase n=1 Tax=Ancylobacter crimeensis TaxID=2579147 RepID=A0ABT0DCE7_9HYPH|nr:Sir2 family NAD-dependent protein deacetylase [Ancylobacter crimeensis]MCK0197632.1 Sir2 family NAD-dependent protein deacetylase [Ancylobacter crimeensis]
MTVGADIKAARAALAELLGNMRAGIAFTGAGISTECGIPDFRSPGGLWSQNKPIPYDAFVSSRAARNEAWRRRFAMEEAFGGARPGRGHAAVAGWLADGRLLGVVTQNIDGLHQLSGVPDERLVELHGNSTYAVCLDCNCRYSLSWVRKEFDDAGGVAPDCIHCDGPVKTATISFGQAMPAGEMMRAHEWAMECDVFVVLGSSLVVYPAAYLPIEAKQAGARLVIVNREPTELDPLADLVIHADIGDVLDGVLPHPAAFR